MEHRVLKLRHRRRGRVPEQLYFKCRMVNNQVSWCRMLCNPIDDKGRCGRPAPHGLRSEHHKAITAYKERKDAQECAQECAEERAE